MKKLNLENKQFYLTWGRSILVIIFIISCTWAVAVIKINLENKVSELEKNDRKQDDRLNVLETKQAQQDITNTEIKKDLKYIIQMQEGQSADIKFFMQNR